MNWYYANEGQQLGPITQLEFDRLVSGGTIQPHTLVWHDGLASWREYGRLTAGLEGAFCSFCGREYAPDDMIKYGDAFVCAQCKPIFAQRLKEGLPLPGQVEYGGFWIRFGAKFIDGLILWVVQMVFYFPFMFFMASNEPSETGSIVALIMLYGIQFLFAFAYPTFFIGRYQATLGKMACGLKVVMDDGGRVTYLRAFARSAAEILSALILYIGYFMAGFDEEKRTLHDRICSTRVVRK
jgi:uncharacterized RDD family membrane protein YckC